MERKGRFDEAIAQYQKALEIKPDVRQAHNNLGIVLAECGRVDEAIAHYRKALEIEPDYADAYNNLGIALANRGQLDEAIDDYRKALKIKPDYAEAHNNLAIALGRQRTVRRGHRPVPKGAGNQARLGAGLHYNLGNALTGGGRFDEAIAEYQKALELKPDYAKARNNLGSALYERGRVSEGDGPTARIAPLASR